MILLMLFFGTLAMVCWAIALAAWSGPFFVVGLVLYGIEWGLYFIARIAKEETQ